MFLFLRRMQNKIPRPISAIPRMGPTTAPAIQALLPPLFGAGAAVPVEVADDLVVLASVEAGVDDSDVEDAVT